MTEAWYTNCVLHTLIVRFGSKAEICSAPTHVRFTPDSDRESEFPQMVMSALPLKADKCDATAHPHRRLADRL
jgi:hypothetical protein